MLPSLSGDIVVPSDRPSLCSQTNVIGLTFSTALSSGAHFPGTRGCFEQYRFTEVKSCDAVSRRRNSSIQSVGGSVARFIYEVANWKRNDKSFKISFEQGNMSN